MPEAMRQCFLRWRMRELLSKYPGLGSGQWPLDV